MVFLHRIVYAVVSWSAISCGARRRCSRSPLCCWAVHSLILCRAVSARMIAARYFHRLHASRGALGLRRAPRDPDRASTRVPSITALMMCRSRGHVDVRVFAVFDRCRWSVTNSFYGLGACEAVQLCPVIPMVQLLSKKTSMPRHHYRAVPPRNPPTTRIESGRQTGLQEHVRLTSSGPSGRLRRKGLGGLTLPGTSRAHWHASN